MKKERKDYQIHFRMTDEELNELDMVSYLCDTSKSELLRRALHFYLNLQKHAPDVLEEFERKVNQS